MLRQVYILFSKADLSNEKKNFIFHTHVLNSCIRWPKSFFAEKCGFIAEYSDF